MPPPKPKRRRSARSTSVLALVDRYLVVFSAAVVAAVWIVGDIVGYTLSEGSKAAMGTFILYAALKSRTDARWRELEEAEADRLALEAPATPSVAPPAAPGTAPAKEGTAP